MGSLYSEHPTWLHRVPAALKLLVLALAGGLQYSVHSLLPLGAGALLAAGIFLSLGRAMRVARRLVLSLLLACALLLAFHGLQQQWELGALSSLRLLATSLLGVALTLTTRMRDLLLVLERLLAPLRTLGVNTDRLALMLALMLRFTEHFFVVWSRLDDAHRVRTGRSGGLRLLAPLTIHMLGAARRVADTLQVRSGG